VAWVSLRKRFPVVPLLQIHLLEGRSPAVKEQLVGELTEVIHRVLGSRSERISVLITEYTREDWNVGGKPLEVGKAVQDD
jgi:4-oxalocrotonate tautomerase